MELNSIFKDGMVFCADKPIRIFGTGVGKVAVQLYNNAVTFTEVGETWAVELSAMEAGGPYSLVVTMNDTVTIIRDVYVGAVFLMAGQSNMQMALQETDYPAEQVEAEPLVRFFDVTQKVWRPCTPESAASVSAIAYHTALAYCRKHGVAVGMFCCYLGASIIESWMCEEDSKKPEIALPIEKKHPDHTWPDFSVWNVGGHLYTTRFSVVSPFAVKGVVWYQGESDTTAEEGALYERELTLLVRRWRTDLQDAALPFCIVQIADFDQRRDDGWRAVQEAQKNFCCHDPYATLVISRDICDSDTIHPIKKSRLAQRIFKVMDEWY